MIIALSISVLSILPANAITFGTGKIKGDRKFPAKKKTLRKFILALNKCRYSKLQNSLLQITT
jgi:hypothetical protein